MSTDLGSDEKECVVAHGCVSLGESCTSHAVFECSYVFDPVDPSYCTCTSSSVADEVYRASYRGLDP